MHSHDDALLAESARGEANPDRRWSKHGPLRGPDQANPARACAPSRFGGTGRRKGPATWMASYNADGFRECARVASPFWCVQFPNSLGSSAPRSKSLCQTWPTYFPMAACLCSLAPGCWTRSRNPE